MSLTENIQIDLVRNDRLYFSANHVMTKKTNKNFFGMTISIQDDSVVSCGHMEPLFGQAFKELEGFRSNVGICYRSKVGTQSFSKLFGFSHSDTKIVKTTPVGKFLCSLFIDTTKAKNSICHFIVESVCLGGFSFGFRCKNERVRKPFTEDWRFISFMGTTQIQHKNGVVFNAPYAIGPRYDEYYRRRVVSTIVSKVTGDRKYTVAKGNWLDSSYAGSFNHFKRDPHFQDQTGLSIAKGTFYSWNQDLEHFAVGAPNAHNLQGRVYICHDCFGTLSHKNDRVLKAKNPQTGEKYGASVAAVDIDGDGIDDVVVGAPLHYSKVLG